MVAQGKNAQIHTYRKQEKRKSGLNKQRSIEVAEASMVFLARTRSTEKAVFSAAKGESTNKIHRLSRN